MIQVLVGVLILAQSSLFGADSAAGIVKLAEGASSVVRAGQTVPLQPGDAIRESDTLRTGPDGRLGVTLKDGTRLSLGPNSELALTKFAFAPADGQLGLVMRLVRGAVAYVSGRIAKLAPESIRIETPASIIGVRGTHLLLGADQL